MIAQIISQVSSHFIIANHRRIVEKATSAYKRRHNIVEAIEICRGGEQPSVALASPEMSPTGTEETLVATDDEEELRKHTFSRPHRGENEKLVVRTGIDKVIWVVAGCLLLFVILGCSLPSFSIQILGIIGLAVESGQGFNEARTDHSVFTVIKLLFEEARFLDTAGDYIGLGTLSILLIFSVLIVPLVQALALLRQWFLPATTKTRAKLSILTETLQAWQYAEVYIIAVFVASW
jgi:hypothetical protein